MTTTAQPSGGCPFGHGNVAVAEAAQAPEDHHGYEPFNMKDPFAAYQELREQQPVMFDERVNLYVVTKYEDIKAVFEDWETFSSENAQKPVRGRGAPATKIMEEGGFTAYSGLSARRPPEHTRIRAVAQKQFTPRRYKALEPTIRKNVVDQIEAMLAKAKETGKNEGEIIADLAYTVPTVTILTLIGADVNMVDTYKRWSDSRAAMTWGNLTDEEQIPHAHNMVEYWNECQRLVEEAKAGGTDSLTADLVKAQQEGAEISDHEIASLLYSLLFAGHETTTTLIANSFRVLLNHREAWNEVLNDPKKIPAAIDEVLRYSGSIVGWRRKATKETEVGGVVIPEGAELILMMGSANRDANQFEDAESFDINRANARDHLSFGFGIHYCLGNMLARLQARIAVEEMARLVPDLELVNPQDIDFRENISFRVPVAVPVTWGKA